VVERIEAIVLAAKKYITSASSSAKADEPVIAEVDE
jgi:hypothetical protein